MHRRFAQKTWESESVCANKMFLRVTKGEREKVVGPGFEVDLIHILVE